MTFHFIVTVWGDLYVDLFLDLCLPNQLTAGNLLAVRASGVEAVYIIYTTEAGRQRILANSFYQQLAAIMPVQIHAVDFFLPSRDSVHSLDMMTKCHQIALPASGRAGAHLVFLPPDQVYSDGTFARLVEIARTGTRVVLISPLRVSRETFRPAFEAAFTDADGHTPAPARPLVALGLRHLHPMSLSYIANAEWSSDDTTTLLWPVGDEGYVNSSLVSHPLMVKPRNVDAVPTTVFDVDYPIKACPNVGDYYVVRDSDEMTAFELSPREKADNIPPRPRGFNIYRHAAQARHTYNRIHRRMSRQMIRVHPGAMSDAWEAVEARAARTVFAMRLLVITSRRHHWYPHLFLDYSHVYDVSAVKRVVVFGTGAGGRQTRTLADICGWAIVRWIDNADRKWGTMLDGIPVSEPASLRTRDYDLILVASEPGKTAIFRQLDGMGFRHRRDYIYFRESVSKGGVRLALERQ